MFGNLAREFLQASLNEFEDGDDVNNVMQLLERAAGTHLRPGN